MTLAELLAHATSELAAAGIDRPRREARLLAAHALGITQADLIRLPPDHPIEAVPARALVACRAAREPMAFITGTTGFWTLDLAVDPSTLIPRADTEALIEAALALRPDRAATRTVLDLGCGTGALLLAALAEYPHAWGLGIDRAEAACRLAAANARRNHLAHRAAFLCGDWAASLAAPGFDLVLSNPPYIETDAIGGLMPEVARHEPRLALDGGPDGLAAYRRLMPEVHRLLAPAGHAILEIGDGQGPAVADLATEAGLAIAAGRHDLGGTLRAVCLARA